MGSCLSLFGSSNTKSKHQVSNTGALSSDVLPTYSSNTATTSTTSTERSSRSSTTISTDCSTVDGSLDPIGHILSTPQLKVFTLAELKGATKNFKGDMVIGEGGFGKVYKGWVNPTTLKPEKKSQGLAIAVKKLNPRSMQGLEEWQSEVNYLGRLSHPNLVNMLGYCWEYNELLLVYEFMPNGSLDDHLLKRGPKYSPLSWALRVKIALCAARGLAFLHSLETKIIYRDFKAANILLDMDYNAKLSDFGLAKNGPAAGSTHVSTRIMGTVGYADPMYVATGHLYVKSDVYGFGVVLLELLSGQRAIEFTRPPKQRNLAEWAKSYLTNKSNLTKFMESTLEGQYSTRMVAKTAKLALECIASNPKSRPSMSDVVRTLEEVQSMQLIESMTTCRSPANRPLSSPRKAQIRSLPVAIEE